MNFYGHAVVSYRYRAAPLFQLGSMIPDLETMAGVRFQMAGQPELEAGVAFHHRTDGAFHGAPAFCRMTTDGIAALGALGLARGPARAVAHVGIELLLDGELCRDPAGPGQAPYRDALDAADTLCRGQSTIGPENHAQLRALVRRLARAPIPSAYCDPAFVADRLERLLAGRPRLALRDGQHVQVTEWLRRAQPEVMAQRAQLLRQVHERLSRPANTHNRPPADRP